MTLTGVVALTPDEARRLLPEAAAAVLSGESLTDALTRAGLLFPACDIQCRLAWACGHADYERLSHWLTDRLRAAGQATGQWPPTNRAAAMWALAECHEILETEETEDD